MTQLSAADLQVEDIIWDDDNHVVSICMFLNFTSYAKFGLWLCISSNFILATYNLPRLGELEEQSTGKYSCPFQDFHKLIDGLFSALKDMSFALKIRDASGPYQCIA